MVDTAGHRDPDRGVAIGPVERLGGQQVRIPRARRSAMSAGSSIPSPSAERPSRATCSSSSVTRPARARRGSRTPRRPAGSRDRTRTVGALGGMYLPIYPDMPWLHRSMIGSRLRRGLRRLQRLRAGRAPSRRSLPIRGRLAAPRDAAPDVERKAPAVGHERPDQDRGLHRAVGADPAERARVRAAAHGLEGFEDLHRPDLRRARDGPARKRRGHEVEGVVAVGQDAGDRRDEVLHRDRPLEPAQARDPDAARPTDAPEVVAQDVDDHHVLGAILGAGEQLAGERAVGGPVATARPRALDRIGRHDAIPVDGQERLGRGGQQRAGPARERARTEIEVRREERRVPGPKPAIAFPRPAVERRLEPTSEGSPGRSRPRRCARE